MTNNGKPSPRRDYYLALGMILGLIGGAAVGLLFVLVTDLFPLPRCVPFFAGAGMIIGLLVGIALDRARGQGDQGL